MLDKALFAVDELTGFIIAVARVRPHRLADLTPRSVKKKLKDRSFASGVERDEVNAGIELLMTLIGAAQSPTNAARSDLHQLFPSLTMFVLGG